MIVRCLSIDLSIIFSRIVTEVGELGCQFKQDGKIDLLILMAYEDRLLVFCMKISCRLVGNNHIGDI